MPLGLSDHGDHGDRGDQERTGLMVDVTKLKDDCKSWEVRLEATDVNGSFRTCFVFFDGTTGISRVLCRAF